MYAMSQKKGKRPMRHDRREARVGGQGKRSERAQKEALRGIYHSNDRRVTSDDVRGTLQRVNISALFLKWPTTHTGNLTVYPAKKPEEQADFAPVLDIWSKWREYLAGKTTEPAFEQSKNVWIERYEDLQDEIGQAVSTYKQVSLEQSPGLWGEYDSDLRNNAKVPQFSRQQSATNAYCLIRPCLSDDKPILVAPHLLIAELLAKTEELRNVALNVQSMLKQWEEKA
jgi:hypothetical protein